MTSAPAATRVSVMTSQSAHRVARSRPSKRVLDSVAPRMSSRTRSSLETTSISSTDATFSTAMATRFFLALPPPAMPPAPPLDARIAGVGDVTGGVWDVTSGSSVARGGAIGTRDGDASGAAGADECSSGGRLEEDGRAVVRVTITSDVAAVCLGCSPGAAKLPRGVFALEHTAPMVVYQEISAGARGFVVCDGAGRRTPKAGARKKERKTKRLGVRGKSRDWEAERASGSYERSVRIRGRYWGYNNAVIKSINQSTHAANHRIRPKSEIAAQIPFQLSFPRWVLAFWSFSSPSGIEHRAPPRARWSRRTASRVTSASALSIKLTRTTRRCRRAATAANPRGRRRE